MYMYMSICICIVMFQSALLQAGRAIVASTFATLITKRVYTIECSRTSEANPSYLKMVRGQPFDPSASCLMPCPGLCGPLSRQPRGPLSTAQRSAVRDSRLQLRNALTHRGVLACTPASVKSVVLKFVESLTLLCVSPR